MAVASNQAPAAGTINLDHVAHFVPDSDAASVALEHLGFTLTPFSPQSHRLDPQGPLVPAGTGNRCVMLEAGYVEFLTPTGATPVADQLRTAMQRYVGVHLIAFGTAAPDIDYARLAAQGFRPTTPVALQRPISTQQGEDTARFTVVRVPPGTMPEGRIQYCEHHTPHLVWQTRWLAHPNGATGLAGALLCVEDAVEAAQRYSRFSGIAATAIGAAWHIGTSRGALTFIEPAVLKRTLAVVPPALPWIAGYVLDTQDIDATRDYLQRIGKRGAALAAGRLSLPLPEALGGIVIFQPAGSGTLRFD